MGGQPYSACYLHTPVYLGTMHSNPLLHTPPRSLGEFSVAGLRQPQDRDGATTNAGFEGIMTKY